MDVVIETDRYHRKSIYVDALAVGRVLTELPAS